MIIGTIVSGRPVSGEAPSFPHQTIYLSSTTSMLVGDTIEIMLDNGEFFRTTISQILGAGQILITNPLPFRATAGNAVANLTQATIVAPSRAELDTDING